MSECRAGQASQGRWQIIFVAGMDFFQHTENLQNWKLITDMLDSSNDEEQSSR